MKIAVIGGGPGGLYYSILTKKALPHAEIEVFERNRSDDSFGFGVVFSDETLSEFLTRDPGSYELIRSRFAYWDELDVARNGEKVRITGNGFCGCSRKTLLQLLQQRCTDVGVKLHFETEITDFNSLKNYDLVVAADGIGSLIRTAYQEDFGTKVELKRNKFVWMGSTRPLDAFTYWFRQTDKGTMVAHTYQYEKGMSTWIFECSPETWANYGFETTNEADTTAKLQEIFKEELDGHALITNRSHWRQFPHVTNESWHKDNIVLLGDSKATAHFSIGSGTKLAMESAIALSDATVAHQKNLPALFDQYSKSRKTRIEITQHAANVSLDWFEHMDRHIKHPFYQFAFGVMTRAKKVTYENLRLRDSSFTDKVLEEFNRNLDPRLLDPRLLDFSTSRPLDFSTSRPLDLKQPAAFSKFKLRDLQLQNRILMTAMGQYSADEGVVNDWHKIHYGSRANSGLGLIITEMTAISATGRISPGCAGIYTAEQTAAWKSVVDFIHKSGDTKIAIQLGHSGRKGATKKAWEGSYEPLEQPWPLISASAIPFSDKLATPKEMDLADMDVVCDQFVEATANAEIAGFDMIELHAQHGFLLASFISPLTNTRTDEYGGSIENRLKFPIRVFKAMRAAFPAGKPISVRISACDWAEGGITEADAIAVAEAFKSAGADIINVSTGNTVAHAKPPIGRMWQTPFSDTIRNSVNVPTITTGGIQDIDQINTILLNGRADLVALGKPLLLDPGFVWKAMAYEDYRPEYLPKQYKNGVFHLWPVEAAKRKEVEQMRRELKPESHKK